MANIPLPHDHGQHTGSLAQAMPDTPVFETVAESFKFLSDGKRMQLYWILCHCEECVTDLSALMQMSSPAVSHHLKLLKNAGLITSRRDGKEVYYTAAKTELAQSLHLMIENVIQITCPTQGM